MANGRYEVEDLKVCCESALVDKVDHNTCFALLVLADQFGVGRLRRTCFEYIAQRPGLATQENLQELPSNLNEEIKNLGSWIRDGSLVGADTKQLQNKDFGSMRFYMKEKRETKVDVEVISI